MRARVDGCDLPNSTVPDAPVDSAVHVACRWAIAALCMGDRSPIVAKNCDTKPIGNRIWPKFAVMEAIVTRIGASFMITTCLRAYPVQRGAQNGDTFDLISSRKRRHGLRCQGEREARPERRTTAWKATQSMARAAPMTVSAARQPSWLKLETGPRP